MINYDQLKQLLTARIDTISNQDLRENNPEQQLKQLQSISEDITKWHQDHQSQIPAQLNHFLKQSSLTKALDYIQDL